MNESTMYSSQEQKKKLKNTVSVLVPISINNVIETICSSGY